MIMSKNVSLIDVAADPKLLKEIEEFSDRMVFELGDRTRKEIPSILGVEPEGVDVRIDQLAIVLSLQKMIRCLVSASLAVNMSKSEVIAMVQTIAQTGVREGLGCHNQCEAIKPNAPGSDSEN
jgi:hypothetical protein